MLDCCVLAYNIKEYAPAIKIDNPIQSIFTKLNLIILIIHTTSAIKLTKGGAAMLLIIVTNHKNETNGDKPRIPFLNKILREKDRRYNKLPPKNMADDLNPCATINSIAPIILYLVK